MALGSIKKAYEIYRKHDFSRSFQLRILDVGSTVPDYVRKELITDEGRVYITTAAVPGRTITNIDVPFQGFQFKLPGQVAYDSPNPWVLTFKTPGDYLVRNALERWSFETANDETSCGRFHLPCDTSTIDIAILAPNCDVIRVYRLHGVYIQNVSQIDYNQEDVANTTFTAAFHYQYWRPAGANDTGRVEENANPNQDSVTPIFQSYESKIGTSVDNCPTVRL